MTEGASVLAPTGLFADPATFGWICLDSPRLKHWGEKGRVLCGAKFAPGFRHVLDQDWKDQTEACRACFSELVRREFALPFRVGQRVTSRAQGMTLNGRIERFFLFSDGQPALDITREWARPPEEMVRQDGEWVENDIHPGDWYRYAHECRPLKEPAQPAPKKAKAKPTLSPTRPQPEFGPLFGGSQ